MSIFYTHSHVHTYTIYTDMCTNLKSIFGFCFYKCIYIYIYLTKWKYRISPVQWLAEKIYIAGEKQRQESSIRTQIPTSCSSRLFGNLIREQSIITWSKMIKPFCKQSHLIIRTFPHCFNIIKISAYWYLYSISLLQYFWSLHFWSNWY